MRWFLLLFGVVACSCAGEQRDVQAVVLEKPQPSVFVLPDVTPAPNLPEQEWEMPPIGLRAPAFPYLPGESAEDGTRSVGTATEGYLIDAAQIPLDHPHLIFLEVQAQRKLFYTSTEMRTLMEKAATHVAQVLPDTPIYLGNFGAMGGGDIPYSVSHNSGRDADIAFHIVAPSGTVWVPKSFVEFSEDGTWTDPATQGVYRFDVARNWAVVEGLVKHHEGQIQVIFVSNGLRRLLLEHAARMGAKASLRNEAAQLLSQPNGALPHNDHFHVRIYCSPRDVASGCRDTGRKSASFHGHLEARRAAVEAARAALTSADPLAQRNGALRLALLGESAQAGALIALLDSPEATARAGAARALSELHLGGTELGARLAVEENPHVRLEILASLAKFGLSETQNVLLDTVRTGNVHPLDDWVVDERAVSAGALMHLEQSGPVASLVAALSTLDGVAQHEVIHALRFLTNQPWEDAQEWHGWFETYGRQTRDPWLISGFQASGFAVKDLSTKSVWELCRAISGPDHLSFNAQRVLMRLAKTEVPSTTWSKYDASFHWRRWFERRIKQLGLPPIPDEMSTTGGYVREGGG